MLSASLNAPVQGTTTPTYTAIKVKSMWNHLRDPIRERLYAAATFGPSPDSESRRWYWCISESSLALFRWRIADVSLCWRMWGRWEWLGEEESWPEPRGLVGEALEGRCDSEKRDFTLVAPPKSLLPDFTFGLGLGGRPRGGREAEGEGAGGGGNGVDRGFISI